LIENYIRSGKSAENGEMTFPVPYGKIKSVRLCPEPLEFISALSQYGNNKEQCRACFERLSRNFKRIELQPQSDIWWNTSADQLNIRFGIEKNTDNPVATQLGDITVHGLIAGQTGSGKSVLLHNMIFNLMVEYSPWELDLYLADFKRVEFSKYMDESHPAPHVVACAATGEIRYVLSLIQHLVNCMNAREDLFKRMGFEKISKFRSFYPDIVLPRILLIVDEFQQMFLEASAKESELIQRMLTAIVKKGRATGVHVIFASQEMSGTLSRSALANFRMRVALNCDPNVSMDILGNRAASSLEKGYVLVNTSDYSEATNRMYRVPYVETEITTEQKEKGLSSYFDEFLKMISNITYKQGFSKNSKFYQEDFQESFDEGLLPVLHGISSYRKSIRDKYFDAFTLGRYVTFSSKKYDIQSFFVERGRNKNILAISPKVEDICYLQKLFVANLCSIDNNENIVHYIYSFIASSEKMYRLDEELSQYMGNTVHLYRTNEELAVIKELFTRMKFLRPIFDEVETPLQFALLNYQRNIEDEIKKRPDLRQVREECIPIISETFKDITIENGVVKCAEISQNEGRSVLSKIARNTADFCMYQQSPEKVFPRRIVWLIGVDVIERLPDWLLWMMKNGMDYNTLFICLSATEFDSMTQLAKSCDYIFLGGTNRRIYDRLNINYTQRDPDSIVLDMVIRSSGEERSFKKYRCEFGMQESERIAYDELLK